jgi:hypothetical protein
MNRLGILRMPKLVYVVVDALKLLLEDSGFELLVSYGDF